MSPHPERPHFEGFVDQAHPNEFRFRIVGANGEPMAQSEGYVEKWEVERAAKSVNSRLSFVWVDG